MGHAMDRRRFFTLAALRKLARRAAIAVVVYALLGFVVVPRVARVVAEKKLGELLHRRTTIERVALNPFTLEVTIDRLAVADRDGGPFVSFERLFVDFQALSVVKGGVIVRDVILQGPAITVVRETPERYSFTDLIEQFSAPTPAPSGKPARYSLNNIQILGGSVDLVDRPKQATHTVRDVHVAVPFLSNLPYDLESYVQPAFSATVNGTPVKLDGRTKPFSESRETSFDVDLSGLSIPRYMEYVPLALRFTVPSGLVDAQVALSFNQHEGRAPDLTLAGHLAVKGLAVKDLAGKPVAGFALLDVTIGRSDLVGGKIVLDQVRLEKPVLHVERDGGGKVNLAALAPAPAAAPAAAPDPPAPAADGPKPTPFGLEVGEARLVDGTVHFSDVAPGGAFATTLSGLAATLRHFSTEPGKAAALDVRLATEAGETIHHAGEVVLEPLRAGGRLDVKGLVMKRFAPYYAPSVLVDLDDGTLDLGTRFDVDLSGKSPRLALSDLAVSLAGVRAHRRGNKRELCGFESFEVKDAHLDLAKRSLTLGEVTSHKGHVVVERAANGTLNLATLVPPPPPRPEARPAPPPAAAEQPWSVEVGKLAMDAWSVRVEDRVPEHPVTLIVDPLALGVEHFNLARGTRFNVSVRARINRSGSLDAAGSVVLDPLSAQIKLDAKALDLLPFQPYFTERVNLLLTSGNFSGAGDLTLSTTAQGPRVTYKGKAGLNRLAAVDKKTSEDFLKWDSLYLTGVDVASDPPSLAIGEVALTAFYSRLAINPDATLNLRDIVVPAGAAAAAAAPAAPGAPAASAAPAAPSAPPPSAASVASAAPAAPAVAGGPVVPVRIDTVTLQGGTIDFTDRLVKPSFSTSLREVGGRISGLSSDETRVADLDLRAKLEDYAPLEIAGKVNPLAKELAVDVKVSFRDIDVSPLSPYSGKYAGYTISKGKLSLDLKYTVEKKKLTAQNAVFIDQLTLGDPVESESATRLPVRLAIALLKDRKGEIHINLPLSGTIDDPKFSLGGLILDVLENLLVKAVTAPFALLGSLVGHGEELSYLEFDDGQAVIPASAITKLAALAKAVADRPVLKLDVTGHVDPSRDREGLRRLLFNRKLKAQKLKDLTTQGVGVGTSVDDVKVETAEYAHYLELAYKDETFPKPRNVLGMAKDLPPSEMEKLMLTHITVADDDLRLLAHQRAQGVKDQLTRAKVDPERIFVVEPKTLAPEAKDKLKASRVDFVIK
jgi:uncharacterized protein involved in outer membrane biogenesis